ncbi:glutamate synthase (NADH) large subunit [Leadbetterella byssophila DSM 17132]|uniref:Glutamate synthase [NADPH] large chain n=1 Tax=Leadbetterella byssophila (strain DSM 17132 / JCM 16389 / KACC 11308 / NBRC 106382 / 4M15) TaxID=649349 RepID=E4RXL9_LEAB4|nr:glutamate synthase large subunit [Leadbetterella byssophila]ADQ17254.1 glutamate synthase (NADH) large subunit [Leadbetterella byssophila DSM 17132]
MKKDTNYGMYLPDFEHDACGIGFRAHLKGSKSHQIVADAITMLERMDHRGACGCDPNTGDGAGILLQIPHEFLYDECLELGFRLPRYGEYAVGMIFFPQDEKKRRECKEIIERKANKLGFELLGYRKVPTRNETLGEGSLSVEPWVEQLFLKLDGADHLTFERKLYVFRQITTKLIRESVASGEDLFYYSSLSTRTISYKGQLTTDQLKYYFPDITRPDVISAFAIVHSRFSTNTFPSWKLAQPFRYIAHNGEINTVKGNVNWIKAGEASFYSEFFTEKEMQMILPICHRGNSDSAHLDNAIELLHLSGRSLPHVMMMLIPEAWEENPDMDPTRRAFYEFHSSIIEPWDGPASISFTDGNIVGATLDRNGLRPSRYWVLKDDTVVMASEAGVLDIDPEQVAYKGRLQPGKMFVVDMEKGRIIPDEELKAEICSRQPYQKWLDENKIMIQDLPESIRPYTKYSDEGLLKRQISAGMTSEDLRMILTPMSTTGAEAMGSMGIDIPLAVLSQQSQHISSYFKQLFAQVTNPPIDSIRERSIMSLISFVGASENILSESPRHCRQVQLNQPVLTIKEFDKLRFVDYEGFQAKTINSYFNADAPNPAQALEFALERICRYAVDAIYDGFEIIILSDRAIDSDHAPIPSLLAVSAVHHHLIRKGLRGKIGLLVESSDIWETHHFATLIGYGASGICPYIAFETIASMNAKGMIPGEHTDEDLYKNYIKAVNKELLKIFSKMGISTLASYRGAQIFECIGLKKDLVDKFFTGTVSRIGGLGIDEIAKEILIRHSVAFPKIPIDSVKKLEVGGVYQWKHRGEKHLFNPDTIHLLQQSARATDPQRGYEIFKKYSKIMNEQADKTMSLRSLLKFTKSTPISIDEVEPVENILKRFATGAMSFGSISWEAHTTLAIAMNRIGGMSNSGEGGEDEVRYELLPNGDSMNSKVKQVASGRFGVTSYYLSNADELQIKLAQGAKPGEGGQLPGHKVDEWIGRVRHSTPGVGLISPPPHHDIYSIEDLAQLIFDLKNANSKARISVKLVSETGVGTVASGVAKAHADAVLISGYDGGTGASPLSSIRHAGLPWELGLAETHQTLVRNKLRGRIAIQVDGQLRTGRDIVIAALLGAEEFGVATAALVSVGCIMMRKCHLNTCPVGIATQNKELRALFSGQPEHVVNMFTYMAMEVREIMAELGFRTLNEMVGQSQYLVPRTKIDHWKLKQIDLSKILYKEEADVALYKQEEQDHGIENVLDKQLIADAKVALTEGKPVYGEYVINNLNRSIGAMISNEISKKYKGAGLPEGTVHYKFKGTAGQSFGAFSTKGLRFELEGDANDYFGKGLCGAELIVYPSPKATFKAHENMAVGNVSFYGATSGEAYIRGMAGERFCVRNSGARVVVEGIGDHGCEYMTGGTVVILGETGRNFAAGMSGGLAFVYDPHSNFNGKCNKEMVDLDELTSEDIATLKEMITKHFEKTQSELAKEILENWSEALGNFVKVFPRDYKKILSKTLAA